MPQLGLTFSNDEGELAPGVCTYQFNFKFSLADDIYAQDSIDLLTRSGIDFRRHEEYGIDVIYFAEARHRASNARPLRTARGRDTGVERAPMVGL